MDLEMQSERLQLSETIDFSRTISGMWKVIQWNKSKQELLAFIEGCIDLGVTTFDHADIYGSYRAQQFFAETLDLKPSLRDQIQLISKVGIKSLSDYRPNHLIKSYDSSKVHVLASVDHNLKALNTDYLDILLIHRPDYLMNADELAETLQNLYDSGRIKSIGVSNFSSKQIELLQSRLSLPIMTNQIELSLTQTKYIDNDHHFLLQQHSISAMAWSPLAHGRIFNSSEYETLYNELKQVAWELGTEADSLALAWIMKLPILVMPVVGTSRLEGIKAAVKAESINMSHEQWYRLLQAAKGKPVI